MRQLVEDRAGISIIAMLENNIFASGSEYTGQEDIINPVELCSMISVLVRCVRLKSVVDVLQTLSTEC